jgi:DNA-binding GntR family transcriptional regulator
MWHDDRKTEPDAERSTLAEEAYTVIRERIVRGELGLGQAVSRRKLAAELGIGFLPVSEALRLLQFEGLLESRPRAGTRVRIPTPDDVKGHYLVREALEVQAAVVFTDIASRADRLALRRMAHRVDVLALQNDRLPYLVLHQQLHRSIAEGTRCAALCDAIERTHALASIWIGIMRQGSATDAHRHADFVEAVVSGDAGVAAQAVREHLAVSRERSLRLLEPYFELRKTAGGTFARGRRRTPSAEEP